MTDHDQELQARRASSFGAQATAYEVHRPDYPADAVRWALEPAGEPAALTVLDLGAGTGKLTAVLAAAGARVVAVEPDPEMLAELRRGLPDVESHRGSAERLPLPDASFDAVCVGQALHWFDKERAMPEIARVLRPGGVLAGLWNADDHAVDWVAGLARAAGRDVDVLREASDTSEPDLPPFTGAERRLFDHAHRRTVDSLVATIGTYSQYLVMEPPERAAALGRIRDYLASLPQSAGEFDLPLVTLTVRWRLPRA